MLAQHDISYGSVSTLAYLLSSCEDPQSTVVQDLHQMMMPQHLQSCRGLAVFFNRLLTLACKVDVAAGEDESPVPGLLHSNYAMRPFILKADLAIGFASLLLRTFHLRLPATEFARCFDEAAVI